MRYTRELLDEHEKDLTLAPPPKRPSSQAAQPGVEDRPHIVPGGPGRCGRDVNSHVWPGGGARVGTAGPGAAGHLPRRYTAGHGSSPLNVLLPTAVLVSWRESVFK